jgi:hypothetical protein
MSTSITVFAADSRALSFSNKKGELLSITAEGAVFKGGAALAALKDASLDSALTKAVNGRYMAAADIIEAAYPSVGKAVRSLLGDPCANKTNFAALLGGVERAIEPAKGWSKKALAVRTLVKAMRSVPAFTVQSESVTIEA